MSGFFDAGEFRVKESETIEAQRNLRVPACGACKLHKHCKSPKIGPQGEFEKKIMVVTAAPGATDDKTGELLKGDVGSIIRLELRKRGIDLEKDCIKIAAVNCRPEDDEVEDSHIAYCRPILWNAIKKYKPRSILLLGDVALKSFLGHRWKKEIGTIRKWRGWVIPDQETQAWVVPVFHPVYIEYNKDSAAPKLFNKDLDTFKRQLNRIDERYDFPVHDPKEKVRLLYKATDIIQEIQSLIKSEPSYAAFDYETTGLKPHKEGHKIVSCSIAWRPDSEGYDQGRFEDLDCIAFPVNDDPDIKNALRKFLKSPIKKIASNMKFEEAWSRTILNTSVNNWHWDTMIAAHFLDCREGITSIKFQYYVKYGVVDYDSHIEYYLQSDGRSANDFNRIYQIPIDDLLLYNGIDSVAELLVAEDQMTEVYHYGTETRNRILCRV
jgi:uracil-DNA glycosylase family 4